MFARAEVLGRGGARSVRRTIGIGNLGGGLWNQLHCFAIADTTQFCKA